MSACCDSCSKGQGCEGETSSLPPGVIVPGPEPGPVIEAPGEPMESWSLPTGADDEAAARFARLRCGSPREVARRLAMPQGTSTALEPLDVGECTRGSVDLVIIAFESMTSIEVILEEGLDAQNYSRVSSTVFKAAGFARFRFARIASKFIRLYFVATGSAGGVGVMAATVNGSRN